MFDQKYLDTYLGALTDERTKHETDFLIEAARLQPSDEILDLACGHGRHSIELAKRGFTHITGLDYSQVFIDKAITDAASEGVDVRFVQGDMRKLAFTDEFGVVMTIFTTMGYFDDETNKAVLREANKALKPTGRFFIDTLNADAVASRFETEGKRDPETGLLKTVRQVDMSGHLIDEVELYDTERQVIHSHREWTDKGEQKEYDYWLHVYTMPQWEQMLSDAGFTITQTWGNYEGEPYGTEGTPRTIILAEKGEQK